MILYQGSQFVKGNKFKDTKGNILVFEKNTKDGRLFSTPTGSKIGLTESQVSKLVLAERKALHKEADLLKEASYDSKGDMELATLRKALDDLIMFETRSIQDEDSKAKALELVNGIIAVAQEKLSDLKAGN